MRTDAARIHQEPFERSEGGAALRMVNSYHVQGDLVWTLGDTFLSQ